MVENVIYPSSHSIQGSDCIFLQIYPQGGVEDHFNEVDVFRSGLYIGCFGRTNARTDSQSCLKLELKVDSAKQSLELRSRSVL